MRVVGIKVLKNKLSEYIRLAASGVTVLVTDRDQVVAEIRPPQAGRGSEPADVLLADAVRKGWIAPALVRSATPPPSAPVASFRELMEELRADREDR